MALNIVRNPNERPPAWSALVIVDDADEIGIFTRPFLENYTEEDNTITVLLFTWEQIEEDPDDFQFLEQDILNYSDQNVYRRLMTLLEPKTFEVTYTFTVQAHSQDEALERINDEGFDGFDCMFGSVEEV